VVRRVAVLALQGDFAAHAEALAGLGFEPVLVRRAGDLAGVTGLVLPGGESTTQRRLIASAELEGPLDALVRRGVPVLATCAGLILAARAIDGESRGRSSPPFAPRRRGFGWLDVAVARNGWGRQIDSFEGVADDVGVPLLFIRAPRIVSVGPAARVRLALDGEPVMVRQGNVTGATFHPELTAGARHLIGEALEPLDSASAPIERDL
jgi:pyridoxal 5'-phosphate synthase pdxT subunit